MAVGAGGDPRGHPPPQQAQGPRHPLGCRPCAAPRSPTGVVTNECDLYEGRKVSNFMSGKCIFFLLVFLFLDLGEAPGMQFPRRARLLGARLARERFCSKKRKTSSPPVFFTW